MMNRVFILIPCLVVGCTTPEQYLAREHQEHEHQKSMIHERGVAEMRTGWVQENPTASDEMKEKVLSGELSTVAASSQIRSQVRATELANRNSALAAYLDRPSRVLPPKIRQSLIEKRVALGMTAEEVLLVQDPPKARHQNVNNQGSSELWVCNGFNLQFQDGFLESWSN